LANIRRFLQERNKRWVMNKEKGMDWFDEELRALSVCALFVRSSGTWPAQHPRSAAFTPLQRLHETPLEYPELFSLVTSKRDEFGAPVRVKLCKKCLNFHKHRVVSE
jgi:hypothetical protein